MKPMIDVVELAAEMVRRPSLNPMGRGEPDASQREFALWLAGLLTDIGAQNVTTAAPREQLLNVLATFDFGCDETIIFTAHIDTVPPRSGTHDSWFAQVHEDRLWGRGACDDKGPMAAMVAALANIVKQHAAGLVAPRRNVLFIATCDEEHGFTGVRHIVEQTPHLLTSVRGQIPVGVLAAEPTLCQPIIAHKGVTRWRCVARGKSAHSSTPQLGENAILNMSKFVVQLGRAAREMQETGPRHPILGSGTLSPGVIAGGTAVNVVPDLCTLDLDRRLIPGETPEAATEQLQTIATACGVKVGDPIMWGLPLETARHSTIVSLAIAAARAAEAPITEPGWANYATDAAFFPLCKIPAVVIGPGNIAQAHTNDEYITTAQLHMGQRLFENAVHSG